MSMQNDHQNGNFTLMLQGSGSEMDEGDHLAVMITENAEKSTSCLHEQERMVNLYVEYLCSHVILYYYYYITCNINIMLILCVEGEPNKILILI